MSPEGQFAVSPDTAYRSQKQAYGAPVDPARVFWLRDHMDMTRPTGRRVLITTEKSAEGGAVPAFAYGDLDRANQEHLRMMLALAVSQATPALGTCPVSAAAALYEGHRTVVSIPMEKWVSVMDGSWLSAWSSLFVELFQYVVSHVSRGSLRRGTGLYAYRGRLPSHYRLCLRTVGESGPAIVIGSSVTPTIFALFVAAAIHRSGIETLATPFGDGDLVLCRDAEAAEAVLEALLQLDGGPDRVPVLIENPSMSLSGNATRRSFIEQRRRRRRAYVARRRLRISDAADGFRLGHLQMRWRGEAVTLTPPDRTMYRFRVRVKRLLADHDAEGARAFVRDWARRFRQWTHAAEFAQAVDDAIVATADVASRLRPSRVSLSIRLLSSQFSARPYDPGSALDHLRERFRARGGRFPRHMPFEFLMSVVDLD